MRRRWCSTAAIAAILLGLECLVEIPGEEAIVQHITTSEHDALRSHLDIELTINHGFPLTYLVRTLGTADVACAGSLRRGELVSTSSNFGRLRLRRRLPCSRLGRGFLRFLARCRARSTPTHSAIVGLFAVGLLLGPVGVWCQQQRWRNAELRSRWSRRHTPAVPNEPSEEVGNWTGDVPSGEGTEALPLVPRLPLWLRELVGDKNLLLLGMNEPDWSTVDWAAGDTVGPFVAEWCPSRVTYEWGPFDNTTLYDRRAISDISSLSGLQSLAISGEHTTPSDYELLRPTSETWLTDQDIAFVGSLTNLRLLILRGGLLTDATLVRLKRLPLLETLEIETGRFTDEGFSNLGRMRHLRVLSLPRVRITDAGLDAIGKLHTIEELEFDGSQVTATGLSAIASLGNLKRLVIWKLHAQSGDLKFLSSLTKLEQLGLPWMDGTGDLLTPLVNLRNLRVLNLCGSTLADEELAALRSTHNSISWISPQRGWGRPANTSELLKGCLSHL